MGNRPHTKGATLWCCNVLHATSRSTMLGQKVHPESDKARIALNDFQMLPGPLLRSRGTVGNAGVWSYADKVPLMIPRKLKVSTCRQTLCLDDAIRANNRAASPFADIISSQRNTSTGRRGPRSAERDPQSQRSTVILLKTPITRKKLKRTAWARGHL
ncbi:hypothetical protein MHYP_G00301060 [Metynnis hypsauchen]